MADMLSRAAETAKELGISEREALVLEFIALEAWAEIKGSNKARALFHLGAMHASGQMDGDTFHKCMALIRSE